MFTRFHCIVIYNIILVKTSINSDGHFCSYEMYTRSATKQTVQFWKNIFKKKRRILQKWDLLFFIR